MTTHQHTETPEFLPEGSKTYRDSPPIIWLARLGAVFVVFQLYVYGRWIFSDKFAPAPTGPDPIPGSSMAWIRFWEIGCMIGGVIFLIWMIRKTRRDKQLPPVGIFVVAWLLAAWQDPGVNAVRPVFGYNAGFFNMGTWGEFIPGWVDKGAENPQPIIYFLASYILLTPLAIMGIDQVIARMRKVYPRINTAGVLAAMLVLFIVLDIVLEQYFHRIGLWTYLRVDDTWSIFSGTMYQFPLYEGIVFGGLVSVSSIAIYCLRDRNGHMLSDIGIDQLKNKRTVTAVRILALTAVFNLIMLVFNLGFNLVNQHAEVQPPAHEVPSYIHHGMCGVGPNPPCPPRP